MFIELGNDNEIITYNEMVSYEEVKHELDDNHIWVEGVTFEEWDMSLTGKDVVMWIDGKVIRYRVKEVDEPDESEDVVGYIRDTYKMVETTSFDNLINMDMLLALDEKLNAIMEHLGL